MKDIQTLYSMITEGQVTFLLLILHTKVVCQNIWVCLSCEMLQTDRLTNSVNKVVDDIQFVVAQLVKCPMHKFVFITTFELFCSMLMWQTCVTNICDKHKNETQTEDSFQSCDEHIVKHYALYQLSYSKLLNIQDIKSLYSMITEGQVTFLLLILHTQVVRKIFWVCLLYEMLQTDRLTYWQIRVCMEKSSPVLSSRFNPD